MSVGSTAVFSATYMGSPQPTVAWLANGKLIKEEREALQPLCKLSFHNHFCCFLNMSFHQKCYTYFSPGEPVFNTSKIQLVTKAVGDMYMSTMSLLDLKISDEKVGD